MIEKKLDTKIRLVNELIDAIKRRDIKDVRDTINLGVDINYAREGHWRPLHFAAEVGNTMIVQLLLSNGAILDAPTDPTTGSDSPLHVAVSANKLSIVQLFLRSGANPFIGASVNGGAPIDYVTADGDSVREHLLRAMSIYKSKLDCYRHLLSDELLFEI